MVQEWLSYLTEPQATRHNLLPGDPLSLQVLASDAQEATLRTPQGLDVELTADPTNGGVVFHTSRTIQPGDYSLEVGLSGDQLPFHVQRDPRESSLDPLQAADLALLADVSKPGRSLAVETSDTSLPSAPIWPMLLTLLVGLILAELMLSAKMSRLRFGNDPIAETSGPLADEASGIPGFMMRSVGRAADGKTAVPRSPVPHNPGRVPSGTGAESR